MGTEEVIRDRLTGAARNNLDAAIADSWLAMLKPGIQLRGLAYPRRQSPRLLRSSHRRRDERSLAVGWLGGAPILPAASTWPAWTGHGALAHVATLDCSALSPLQHLRDAGFPATGWLSFFYFDGSLDNGAEVVGVLFPGTAEGAQVIYTPPGANVAEAHPPAGLKLYPRVEVAAEPILTWATWEHPRLHSGGRPADGRDRVFAITEEIELERSAAPAHQVGGNPNPVQGPVEYEVAYGLASRSGRDKISWSDPAVISASDGWLLLGQFDTDNRLGFMWGDCGRLYYLIRPDDLAAGRFDRVAFTWQCG